MASRNKKRRIKRQDEINLICKKSTMVAKSHYAGQGQNKTGLHNLPRSGMSANERRMCRLGKGGHFIGGHDHTIDEYTGKWRKWTSQEKSTIQIINRGLINLKLKDPTERYIVRGVEL